MKFPNYLLNVFAVLGVIFAIFLSCSVASEDSVASDNSAVTSGIGKYQMKVHNYLIIFVLDTETGTIQEFHRTNNNLPFELFSTNETQ